MIARIVDGAVAEIRNISLLDIPEHKRYLWRPVSYEGDGSISETIVEASRVRVVRSDPPLTDADYADAVQTHIEATAASRGYKDAQSLASYKFSTIETWAAEASAFVEWRDRVWIYGYAEIEKIQRSTKARPSIAALIASLPAINWPA